MNYGRSKMKAEKIVQDCFKKGDMETVILRPPWFYGIFQPLRQTLFFSMIRSGKFPLFGDGENKRSMIYLGNLCQAIHLAAITQNIRCSR
jgi:nucleoside-diphosphate-sugar epimerase